MNELDRQLTEKDVAMPRPEDHAPSPSQFDWRLEDDPRIKRIIDLSPEQVEQSRGSFSASEYKEFLAFSILAGEGKFDTFDAEDDSMKPQRDRFALLTAIKEGRPLPTPEINRNSDN